MKAIWLTGNAQNEKEQIVEFRKEYPDTVK
jgi:hypothetical protein